MDPKKKSIDLEKIIREKNPRLIKLLPGFIFNYIRKVIHENEMNDFLAIHGEKKNFDFIRAVLNELHIQVHSIGEENIPATGGCIFAANHPLGGLDALSMMLAIEKKRSDIKFIVNDILTQLTNLEGLFTGVNKHGRTAVQTLAEIDQLYGSEKAVLIFPAGLVSRKQHSGIKDLEWKKSFITKAKKHQRNIIPVYIDARNSERFYNLSKWRKRFGIKANIEMFYLVERL